MKKTLFIALFTAALMGSAYANTNYTANPGTHSSPPENVFGTYAGTGEASGGSVEVFEVSASEGYECLYDVYGGHVHDTGNATDNTVTMTGGEVYGWVYGGYVYDGDATGNTVTMTGGYVDGYVFGGDAYSGKATENAVTINDGYVYNNVYGGYVEGDGNATGNTVTMTGGEVGHYVLGCYVETGNATGNTVNMAGGQVGYDVYGGHVRGDGNANGNTVTIAGGEVGVNVCGGYVGDSGDATGNTVHLVGEGASYTVGDTTYKGGNIAIQGNVRAGYVVNSGVSSNNSVHIHGTGINIGDTIGSCQLLTFHLVDTQASGAAAPMVTLGGALDLNGVELGFYGDAVTDWAAFEGKSITLVQAADYVAGVVDGTEVDIINEVGGTLATATLTLGSGNALVLNFSGEAPGGHTSYTANPGSPQTSAPDTIYGAYAETGDVTGGSAGVFEVETGGYESLGNVYGGYAKSGNVSDCSADMTGGQVGFDVYGGYVHDTGNATDNTVDMTGGEVRGDVNGGYTTSGDAIGNTVDMTGGQVGIYVYGGRVLGTGDATGNTVNMTGGKVGYDVCGGNTYSGDATGNTVDMTGGQVGNVVYGGVVLDTGDATENAVTINDAYVDYRVYGGYTKSGNANGNIVNMAGGKGGRYLYGGYVDGVGVATGNTVNMSGGEVERTVVGGVAVDGDATANTVNMTGGTASRVFGGGAGGNGNVSGNTVNMAGGSATTVYGGFSETEDGYAKENFVLITGGKADFVYGGAAGGAATGNTVTMTGGEVGDDVYGGYSYFGEASGNTVHLVGEGASYTVGDTTYKGGNIAIQGSVHAGYVKAGGVGSNNSVHIHGTGVNIGGTIDFSQRLNFHLVQDQAGALTAPMVTLGGALDLTGVELGFYGDAVTDWAAFEGKSITLVSMTSETITGLVTQTDPVDITDEGGKTVATATLTHSDDWQTLYLADIQGVAPVPTAGPDALDVALVNSLWASSAYVREFVRLSGAQGYALKDGDTAVWGGGFGTFMHTTGNRGFKSDGGGYGIGVNHAFSANTQAGISLGQGFGSYHNSGADGATVHQRAILAAATAATRIGKDLSLSGHLAFGNVRNRADCRLDGATERARWNDNVFNLGARAAYDFHVTDTTAITPFLGLDWMNGAHESFTGGFARHYSHGRLNELRMPVGVTVSTSTEVGTTKLLPQLSVAYVPSLAQQVPHANVSSENGNYRVKGYAPGRNAFMLNAGVNAVFSDSWSAGAFYTLETRRHSVDQSVNASVRYTF